MNWGREMEATAISEFEEVMGVSVQRTGLTLHQLYPYLGASSDGLLKNAIVEVKCPFSGRDKTVEELIAEGYSHIVPSADGYEINKSSSYYFQVQGEMAIKGKKIGYFVVWTTKDMVIVPVELEEDDWNQVILPRLVNFYNEKVMPQIFLSKTK